MAEPRGLFCCGDCVLCFSQFESKLWSAIIECVLRTFFKKHFSLIFSLHVSYFGSAFLPIHHYPYSSQNCFYNVFLGKELELVKLALSRMVLGKTKMIIQFSAKCFLWRLFSQRTCHKEKGVQLKTCYRPKLKYIPFFSCALFSILIMFLLMSLL